MKHQVLWDIAVSKQLAITIEIAIELTGKLNLSRAHTLDKCS